MLRALWIDDDGQDRFQYELSVLVDHGLVTDWALDATEAVDRLSVLAYDLVLLDQVFPISWDSPYKDVWSGCRLLYWLRGLGAPVGAPQGAMWTNLLLGKIPMLQNRDIPVIIISGFQDDHVDEMLKEATRSIWLFAKPINGDRLRDTVLRILARK